MWVHLWRHLSKILPLQKLATIPIHQLLYHYRGPSQDDSSRPTDPLNKVSMWWPWLHDSSSWLKFNPLPPTDSFPYHVIVLKRKCLELGIVSRELNFYFRSQAPFWSYPQPLENFSGPQPSSPPLDPPWPSSLDSPSMLPLSFLVSLNFSHAKSHANQNRNNDHSVNQFFIRFFQQPFVFFTHFLVVCTP